MSVDWSKVGTKATAAAAKHEDAKSDLIVEVGNALGRIYDANPDDPRIIAVKAVLAQDNDKVAEMLGMSSNGSQPGALGDRNNGGNIKYGADCKMHKGDWIVPILNADGSPTNDRHYETHLKGLNYTPHFDSDGNLDGYIKSPTGSGAASNTPANADAEVPLLNRKGVQLRKIKVSEGKKDTKLTTNWSADGTSVESFQELGFSGRR